MIRWFLSRLSLPVRYVATKPLNVQHIDSLRFTFGCKKGAALFNMTSIKKAVKSKDAAKKWLWWYRLMAKNLITTIQVNLVLPHPSFTRNQHKIHLNCCFYHFCHQPIPSQPFLGRPLWFHNFFTLAILNRPPPFLQLGCFWVEINSFCKLPCTILQGLGDSNKGLQEMLNLVELLAVSG